MLAWMTFGIMYVREVFGMAASLPLGFNALASAKTREPRILSRLFRNSDNRMQKKAMTRMMSLAILLQR